MSSLLTSDLKIGGVFFSREDSKKEGKHARECTRVRRVFHEQCMFECIFSRIAYIYKQENILIMTTESRYGKSCLI